MITLNSLAQHRHKKAFMAHVYCGDPAIDFSTKLLRILSQEGVDILEIGIPFSDPLADGKVLQGACQRGLISGTTPGQVFELIKELRAGGVKTPIVLTTYYNIIVKQGIPPFVARAADANIQGIIVPDLPCEESLELQEECHKKRIALIPIIAPATTKERIKKILHNARGFVYLVSLSGVTGSTGADIDFLKKHIEQVRAYTTLPVYIGFGISSKEDIKALKEAGADGFIIGSHICRLYTSKGSEVEKLSAVQSFISEIRQECDRLP